MKKNFVFLLVSGFIFIFSGIVHADTSPFPNIKANGSDGPIELRAGETLNVTISLNAGDHESEAADCWVLQLTPDGNLYYFDPSTLSMKEGYAPTLQAGLVSFPDIPILSLSGLQEGTHIFYFGIDLTVNGVLDIDSLYYDYVQVNVKDGGTPSTYTNSLGQTFALIPAGTFTMGSPSDELGRYSDETQHEVTLTQPFYMQTTEVTQAQWESVMGSNPSYFDGCPTCPVEMVSWDDVQKFIVKMNARGEGTYSLPTEAQWEYAARAGSTTAFYNGGITVTDCGYDPNLNAIGWYCYNADSKPLPVAGKTPNAYGLYDMSGNVWEWCHDWFGTYPSSAVTDPVGPTSGSLRVYRGGCWYGFARYCRSALRYGDEPGIRSRYFGFRLAFSPGQ